MRLEDAIKDNMFFKKEDGTFISAKDVYESIKSIADEYLVEVTPDMIKVTEQWNILPYNEVSGCACTNGGNLWWGINIDSGNAHIMETDDAFCMFDEFADYLQYIDPKTYEEDEAE
jgi:hypothetical protein